MKYAELNVTGKWTLFDAQALDDSYKRHLCRCPECHAQAFLCISHREKENYFRSNLHSENCVIASGGRKFKEATGKVFCFEDVFNHIDKPYEDPLEKKRSAEDVSDYEFDNTDDDPEDNSTILVKINMKRCSTMYVELEKLKMDDFILPTKQVKDYIVDMRNIEWAREHDISGKRMVVMTRYNINALDPPIDRPSEYVCLKDAYTQDPKKALFFFVKFAEPTRDEYFRDQIFGNKKRGIEKKKSKYIVATGMLERLYDPNYTIYVISPLSTARMCFTNNRKPINE